MKCFLECFWIPKKTLATHVKCVKRLKICLKMKEILDLNFPWNFYLIWLCFGIIIGILEKQTYCIPQNFYVAIMQYFIAIFVETCKTYWVEFELKEISKGVIDFRSSNFRWGTVYQVVRFTFYFFRDYTNNVLKCCTTRSSAM